jgi:hypothetical protein
MSSKDFAPKQNIDIQLIKDILSKPSKFTFDAFTKDSPDELKPKTTITN